MSSSRNYPTTATPFYVAASLRAICETKVCGAMKRNRVMSKRNMMFGDLRTALRASKLGQWYAEQPTTSLN